MENKLMILPDAKSEIAIKKAQKYLTEKRAREVLITSTCSELGEEPFEIKHILSPLSKFQETQALTKNFRCKLTTKAMWIWHRRVEIGDKELFAIIPLDKKEKESE